jgi:hypothetical protein
MQCIQLAIFQQRTNNILKDILQFCITRMGEVSVTTLVFD